MYFEIYTEQTTGLRALAPATWRWRLKAANHEIIASGEGYASKAGCLHAVRLVQSTNALTMVHDLTGVAPNMLFRIAGALYFEVYRPVATGLYSSLGQGTWRWRLKGGNHEIVASGEGYADRRNCIHALDLLRSTNTSTPIYDVSAPAGKASPAAMGIRTLR